MVVIILRSKRYKQKYLRIYEESSYCIVLPLWTHKKIGIVNPVLIMLSFPFSLRNQNHQSTLSVLLHYTMSIHVWNTVSSSNTWGQFHENYSHVNVCFFSYGSYPTDPHKKIIIPYVFTSLVVVLFAKNGNFLIWK